MKGLYHLCALSGQSHRRVGRHFVENLHRLGLGKMGNVVDGAVLVKIGIGYDQQPLYV